MTNLSQEYRIKNSIALIEDTYWDVVSVDAKKKNLIKFWRNNDIGTTEEMVWLTGGTETLPTGNTIDTIVSNDAWDTQDVVIEWHTLSWSDLTFVIQTVTLTWTTDVTLGTPLYRATRLYNNGSTDFDWTITLRDDTAATTHLSTDWNNNQSLKCATSTSSVDYWIITAVTCSVNRQNTRNVDFRLQFKEFGKVWRTKLPISISSNQGTYQIMLDQPIIMTPNSDMRILATSSGTATWVEAIVHWYLASIQ